MVNRGVFLDRDGVINELVMYDKRLVAPRSLNEFVFKEEAAEAVTLLKKLGFYVFIITNQPDVHDGLLPFQDLKDMCTLIKQHLKVDYIACAMDRKTEFYKPGTLMVEFIADKFDIDLNNSYIIGDSWRDIHCGYAVGLTTLYIGEEFNSPLDLEVVPDHLVKNVLTAAELIEEIELND